MLFVSAAIVAACGLGVSLINKWEKRKSQPTANNDNPIQTKTDMGDFVIQNKTVAFMNIEFPNRVRIFEDCNRLMQSTTNFDVFLRRADAALDFINWTHKMKDAGMPIQINMNRDEAVADFNRVFNRHSVRIAKAIAEAADTPRKAKNAIPKLEVIKSALKESENLHDSDSMLNALIFNLNIDANGK